ncbi:LOW QUALITY PROTEIN: olfactory receptor 52D1-like [Sphaerodactylus townsendi]|uniref:LOW QUALITY PROTEIN: olfactory receptor 52D1-like n=1 Tax=Sphaerodactylus townsendi TaxID=933632 RepID=UPI0020268019|nr:LOW QUALITY PROTEIN: olfactory receptor 52D1-like [Sphaerodactylus townsendi]
MALQYRTALSAVIHHCITATALTPSSWISKRWRHKAVLAFCLMASLTFLLLRLPFCGPNVISHTFCEHMGIARLACADITLNIWYGLTVALLTTGADALFIAVSYGLDLPHFWVRAPAQTGSAKARTQVALTFMAILMFYVPAFFSIFAYRFAVNSIPRPVHILLANLFAIVPPMLNPIVYGVRTKQIRQRLALVLFPPRKHH